MTSKAKEIIEKLKSNSISLEDNSFSRYKDEIVSGLVKTASGKTDLEIASSRYSKLLGVSSNTLFSELKTKHKTFTKLQKQKCPTLIDAEYIIKNGCLAIVTKDGTKKIADCSAKIIANLINEDEVNLYKIHVLTDDEKCFTMSIPAEDFSEKRILKAKFESAMGHNKSVAANMSAHLGPAIKRLSDPEIETRRIYSSTGWKTINGVKKFLIPGVDLDGVDIELPSKKLCYKFSKDASLEKGLEALDHLLQAHPLESTTIAFSFIMQAPIAELAQWHEERYGLFIQGITGSLKTAFVQVLMCIWGKDFNKDGALLKWGEGATNNAIMRIATHASDLVILIDNFKPNTGGGARVFINLIHNILEGGEKERLQKNSQLRKAGSIKAWPFCTGEDVPNSDAATLARLLIINIPKKDGFNEELKVAQDLSNHLNAVGRLWIQILESWMNDKSALIAMRKLSADLIRKWSERLHKDFPKMVNKMRIATNLATNEFTWHLLTQVPQLQPVLKKYSSAHAKGLEEIAKNLAETTCGSTEAEQFLDALREVLQTGKLKINDKRGYTKEENGFACHFDGWWENGNLCISPEIVTNLLKKHTSLNDNNVSKQTLYRQLEALGAIADRNRNEPTKNFNIGGEPCRALVLKWSAVKYECVDPEEDSGGGYDTVF